MVNYVLLCGSSSSGRAPPCQGGGSEFEPRLPLQSKGPLCWAFLFFSVEESNSLPQPKSAGQADFCNQRYRRPEKPSGLLRDRGASSSLVFRSTKKGLATVSPFSLRIKGYSNSLPPPKIRRSGGFLQSEVPGREALQLFCSATLSCFFDRTAIVFFSVSVIILSAQKKRGEKHLWS